MVAIIAGSVVPTVLIVLLAVTSNVSAQCTCNTTSTWGALKALYDSTDGPHWRKNDHWLDAGSAVCDWHGIDTCNNVNLSSNNLRGTLPPELGLLGSALLVFAVPDNILVGTLPPEFSSWTMLGGIDVSGNNLTGTLPPQYSTWTSVRIVWFGGNNFTGTLPPEYSNWTLSENIWVNTNRLRGTLPPEYSTWRNIGNVKFFGNDFTGTLPPEYSSWVGMQNFFAFDCHFTGTLPPQYSAWRPMTLFSVASNEISGTLPPQYSSWSMLSTFNVADCRMTGALPPEYGSWTKLTHFDVSNNEITGSLPPEYGAWTDLDYFNIGHNKLSGTLPSEFGAWGPMRYFRAYHNNLSGSLPPQYSAWGSSLWIVYVFGNALTGTLSPDYSTFTSLTMFDASFNHLTGTLPPQYSAWPILASILLDNNDFTGSLPAAWSGKFFSLLLLHDNRRLSGTIPSGMSVPLYVSLCNTSVCGRVPSSWSGAQWLCQNISEEDIAQFGENNFSALRVISPPYLPSCNAAPTPTPAHTTPAPTNVASPPPSALTAASGLITAAFGANAISAVFASAAAGAGGTSLGSFVQVSSLSARVSARLRDCGAPSPSSGNEAAVNDEVGSFVGDNPTTLALPGRLSSSGGTVVGNALLLFAAPPVAAGVYCALRKAIAAVRRLQHDKAPVLLRLAVRLHLVVYAWLLAPTAAAAAALLADGAHGGGGGGGPAALGVFGLVVVVAPVAVIAVAYVRSRPLKGKAFSAARSQRRSSFSLRELARRLCADGGSWSLPSQGTAATPRGRSKATTGVVLQLLQHALSETLHGCVYPHGHVFLVDFALAAAQGLLAGSALSPAAAPSCAAVRGLLWSIFALCVCAAVFEAWFRPRATLLDEGITLVMAVWTAVVALLSALDLEDAASDASAAQAAVSLLFAVLQFVRMHWWRSPGVTRIETGDNAPAPRRTDQRNRPLDRGARAPPRLPVPRGDVVHPTSHADLLKSLIEEICAARRPASTSLSYPS